MKRLPGSSLAIALVLGPLACVSIPKPAQSGGEDGGSEGIDGSVNPIVDGGSADADPACVDEDGDGYMPEGCDTRLPFDCDTGEANIHPGAFNDCNAAGALDCTGQKLPCFASMTPNEADYQASGLRISNANLAIFFDSENEHTVSELFNQLATRDYIFDNAAVPQQRFGSSLGSTTSLANSSALLNEFVLGRGISQLRVSWPDNSGFSGQTIFTIYPDGRIHLRNALTAAAAASAETSLRTHLALDPAAFTHVIDSVDANLVQIGDPPSSGFPVQEALISKGSGSTQGMFCAFDGESASSNGIITMGWRAPNIPSTGGGGARLRKYQDSPGATDAYRLSFDFDWFEGASVVPDTYLAYFQLYVGLAPFTNAQACQDGEAHFDGFFNPPSVASGTPTTTGGIGDEDNDGYNEGSGSYQFTLGASKTLQFTLGGVGDAPPSIALSIEEVADVEPVVFLDGEQLVHGKQYFYDVVDLGDGTYQGWLFVNVAGLGGKSIRLEYP